MCAGLAEQFREGWVGILAVLVVLEGLERRICLVRIPRGEIIGVLFLVSLEFMRSYLEAFVFPTLAALKPSFLPSSASLS